MDKQNGHLYSQMVEDHKKLNELVNQFMIEVTRRYPSSSYAESKTIKIDGDSSCLRDIIPNMILQFEKQYNLTYSYNLESMFK
jgi:hypothetical protein